MNVRNTVVDAIARVPARVQTKLLFAFLVIVALLVALGLMGLRIHSGMNERNEELIALQRKIAAYRNVQHDATRQLYGVSSALLAGEEQALDSVLRQLRNFRYPLDRLQVVEKDEATLMADIRSDYDQFIKIETQAIELARSGNVDAARKLQTTEARTRADRLERLTNQLVNVAEADMLDRIEAGQRAFEESRRMVVGFSIGSAVLALFLGYTFSSSILNPLAKIQNSLGRIAGGDFVQKVEVSNRDELGVLADDVNRTSRELDNLYSQIEEQTVELADLNENLQERVEQQVDEIARISRLRRFLAPQIADLVISRGSEAQLESHRGEVTVLFADLRGFTAFAEQSDPAIVMDALSEFHALAGPLINHYEGTLERFLGDGIMVLFNDPVPCPNPDERAVRLALDLQKGFGPTVAQHAQQGDRLGLGIGIARDMATMGRIGFEGRFDYAAIGTAANLAARLCDAAKDGQVLITDEVAQSIGEIAPTTAVGSLKLKGFERPYSVYDVSGATAFALVSSFGQAQ